MSYLLDTHAAIWFFERNPKLSEVAENILRNSLSDIVYISMASVWEFGIKKSLGKLDLSMGGSEVFVEEIERNGFTLLEIVPRHIKRIETLPFIHRDPFDRLLVATAISDNLTLITGDKNLWRYGAAWVW